jgi:hypothetical protein
MWIGRSCLRCQVSSVVVISSWREVSLLYNTAVSDEWRLSHCLNFWRPIGVRFPLNRSPRYLWSLITRRCVRLFEIFYSQKNCISKFSFHGATMFSNNTPDLMARGIWVIVSFSHAYNKTFHSWYRIFVISAAYRPCLRIVSLHIARKIFT